jgi:hypothetical protein
MAGKCVCPRVVATHQQFLGHSLIFSTTSSGVGPLVQLAGMRSLGVVVAE